jgi:Protein of unknown function (DUF2997)
MAEYQTIEYRIGKDGKIIETVLNASGSSCLSTTAGIEQALGAIASRELLPDHDQTDSDGWVNDIQSLTQA